MARKSKTQAKKEFAIIGLGRFGASLARRLEAMGHIVLGIDIDMTLVQAISDDITSAAALDATNEDALQEVDIASFGTVIIAIGKDFETNALVTAYLKSLGIPRVICVAETARHRDILLRIGADQVIVSDEDSGLRLAETLAIPTMLERVVLDSDHSLTEFETPNSLVGQPVASLSRREISVVLIQRQGQLLPSPSPDTRLQAGDAIFAVGHRENLQAVASLP